jgi:thiazole synthase
LLAGDESDAGRLDDPGGDRMTTTNSSDNKLTFGPYSFSSRLIAGTGKFTTPEVMREALQTSGTEMVTVAIRRVDLKDRDRESILGVLEEGNYTILPNTAACYTAKDAVLTAELAREALDTPLIKLEVIGDEQTLFPDTEGLMEAARTLVKEGYVVLPYTNDDPILARKLEDIGCAAVMPLAAPIGSGLGVQNPYNLQHIQRAVTVPVIVDAGVGTASDAAIAMELGCDGVLMNTGIAGAQDPVRMARAMRRAVQAGRDAFLAGRIPRKLYATASSPLEGVIGT